MSHDLHYAAREGKLDQVPKKLLTLLSRISKTTYRVAAHHPIPDALQLLRDIKKYQKKLDKQNSSN